VCTDVDEHLHRPHVIGHPPHAGDSDLVTATW
jgi:hypothetical protein